MNWKGVKVAVTGAGGFIGSHLVEELACRGASVRAMFRYNSKNDWGRLEEIPAELQKNIQPFAGDVTDSHLMQKLAQGQEVVFHLASLIAIPYSYVAPASYVNTNVCGSLNILEACLKNKVKRVVHTSTSEVYGTALYVPIDEEHPLRGQSPYSASKIAADKLAESFYRSFDLPVVILRPFNTYGPRQSARAVIPTIVSQALSANGEISLGDLRPVRDFTYVRDTVEGFLKAAESSRAVGEVVQVGTGTGVTVGQVAEKILRLAGRDIRIRKDSQRIRPSKSEVFRLICSAKKARKLLGWSPRYDLDKGLGETVRYVRQNLGRYKPRIYNL